MQTCQRVRVFLLWTATVAVAIPALGAEPPPRPEHWVAAMYFHRTHRCPTCRRIGSYIEEAIEDGFPEETKRRAVGLYLIDFQDKKNERYARCYKIKGPTLVVANVVGGKVTAWRPMPKVWSLMGRKKEFFEYVQDGVRGYLRTE